MKAETWAASVGEIVRGYVERKLGDLQAKVAALEGQQVRSLTASPHSLRARSAKLGRTCTSV